MRGRAVASKIDVCIFIIAICLAISIVANLIQLYSLNSLKSSAQDISQKLTNYRALQNTQIEAVKDNCAKLHASVSQSTSARNQMLALFKYYSSELGNRYIEMMLQGCYGPLYLVSGVMFRDDISAEDIDDLVLEPDSNFNIRDNAFEGVKW